MKKFITLSMALTMALCSLSYGAVINPKQDGNIVKSYTKTDDTNIQCDVIAAYLKSEDVPELLAKELTDNTKRTDKDVSYEVEGGNIYFNNATLLIYSGANITTVQKLLGHKSVKTTQVYANIMDITLVRDLEKAIYSKAGGKHKGN